MTPLRTAQIQGVSLKPRGETQVMRLAARPQQGFCSNVHIPVGVCSPKKLLAAVLFTVPWEKTFQEET